MKIPPLNTYYLLGYAFRVLTEESFADDRALSVQTVADPLARLLSEVINRELKRGLTRDYTEQSEAL